MKAEIHPNWVETTVTCLGCNTTFQSHSTVPEITVEICSNCHPFYTGKQKLVDTAGRVDRFRELEKKAGVIKSAAKPKPKRAKKAASLEKVTKPSLKDIKQELTSKTVEKSVTKSDKPKSDTSASQ